MNLTRTARTRSSRTRKRAFHFYSPGVVRRPRCGAAVRAGTTSAAAAEQLLLPPLLLALLCIGNLVVKN